MPAPVIERTPLPLLPAPSTAAAPVPPPQPVVPTYVVRRGDTLRSIARDQQVNAGDLASWNHLDNPDRLEVGQVLRLAPPQVAQAPLPVPGPSDISGPGVTTAPLRTPLPVTAAGSEPGGPAEPRTGENYKTSPKAIKEAYSPEALRDFGKLAAAAAAGAEAPTTAPGTAPNAAGTEPPEPSAAGAPATAVDNGGLDWMWPAKGKIVASFSDTANLKGIDIAGSAGTPIVASAAGKVVYAGSGLRGYGKLVIIKHNDTYLSAYAHNRAIVVKEGEMVTRGQKIAEMGNTDADQVKLHFEIRRLGKPVDPVKFLPPA